MNEGMPQKCQETGFDSFSTLVSSALKSLERLKSRYMERFGLSGTHTLCIRQLFEAPNGLTRTELANRLSIDRAQVTRIIGELLSEELVVEGKGTSSYRKKCILTDKGKEIAAEINGIVSSINQFVSGDIPKESLTVFYETLYAICENLKKAASLADINGFTADK